MDGGPLGSQRYAQADLTGAAGHVIAEQAEEAVAASATEGTPNAAESQASHWFDERLALLLVERDGVLDVVAPGRLNRPAQFRGGGRRAGFEQQVGDRLLSANCHRFK
jgi:hypothetical protein